MPRYVNTYLQKEKEGSAGTRYTEEITEDAYKFYTSPQFKRDRVSEQMFLIIEETEKPSVEDTQKAVERIDIQGTKAKIVWDILEKDFGEIQIEALNILDELYRERETAASSVVAQGERLTLDEIQNILTAAKAFFQAAPEQIKYEVELNNTKVASFTLEQIENFYGQKLVARQNIRRKYRVWKKQLTDVVDSVENRALLVQSYRQIKQLLEQE